MEQRLRNTLTAMIQINGLSPLMLNESNDVNISGMLILPGLRDHSYREKEGIKIWKKIGFRYLLVAGIREEPPMEREYIVELAGGDSPHIFFTKQADHTKAQMEWAMDVIQSEIPSLTNIVISTAAYHLPRCYLTFLKSMLRRDKFLTLSSVPLYDSQDPSRDFVGYEYTGGTGIEGEAVRIIKYQDEGDVASLSEYINYLEWIIPK